MDRRTLLASGLAIASIAPLRAQAPAPLKAAQRLPLWPRGVPGGEGRIVTDVFVKRSPDGPADDIAWTHLATPVLKVTPAARPNGTAVLMIPGGGYARIAVGNAPSNLAQLYAANGTTAFELLYRLPHDHWAAGPDAPLQDAQRAMRVIRAGAAGWGFDPAKVLALGFSAGGHLVGRLGEQAAAKTYDPVDAADALPARPMAIGMFFPVVTMAEADAHGPSKRELLGTAPDAATTDRYSLERHVPATMPPTFVCHAADDRTVPYTNSIRMFTALQAAKIPSEMMIGEAGGHGVPLIGRDGKPHVWIDLVAAFAARHGWAA
ncbi:alpha/beta hydrolase [Sphingomonas cynarae]|uniref:Alpha/beta hydrolase n=1 Tax=Sphingomonas cynarae TaxID=930197 RepID=A0ABP7DVV6_9SPHN